MSVHPKNSLMIFAGTSEGLYRSDNQGTDYRPVLRLHGSAAAINYLYIDPSDSQSVYAATRSGLYHSTDTGQMWQSIFEPADQDERRTTGVAIFDGRIYSGTLGGLFYKTEDETWGKNSSLGNQAIYALVADQDFVYAATETSLYKIDPQNDTTHKVFSLGFGVEADVTETGEEEEIFGAGLIRDLAVAPEPDQVLVLAGTKGIFYSVDQGAGWRRLEIDAIPFENITSIEILPLQGSAHDSDFPYEVIIGTYKGAFRFSRHSWTSLYQGLETNWINCLTADREGRIYAGTDRGIFLLSPEKAPSGMDMSYAEIQERFQNEPAISEVQRWAIQYADVHPDKIRRWKSAARQKAILPSLSVGLDRGDTDLYHWDTGGSPDILRKGKENIGWDVSLSWDLGDLVWSSDQTSIDSRAKLMVELREDILDQITRLYFERRRLQIELITMSIDLQTQLDREMRISELTALIDAFTGGEFSRHIKKEKVIN